MSNQPEEETLLQDLKARELIQEASYLNFLKRYEEALAIYDQVIALDPYFASVSYIRASTLSTLKRYEEALVAYNLPIELYPHDASAYVAKGHLLGFLGRSNEAEEYFQKARQLGQQ